MKTYKVIFIFHDRSVCKTYIQGVSEKVFLDFLASKLMGKSSMKYFSLKCPFNLLTLQ